MNDSKINITVMPGAQMNGYVKEQHNYFGTVNQTIPRPTTEERGMAEVPECLLSSDASRLWEQAKAEGWVDEDLQPMGLSRTDAALLAARIGDVLGIRGWAPFERLWHRKNMRQDYNKAQENQKTGDFEQELKRKIR